MNHIANNFIVKYNIDIIYFYNVILKKFHLSTKFENYNFYIT